MLLLEEICLGFHWIKFGWWKSAQPIEYKVYTEYVILASLFKKRQRNKDKITAMKMGKASLWLLAGKTVNFFLKDWFSNCYWLGRHSIPSKWMELKIYFFFVRKYINWTFLGEYKRRSEKYFFGITTKIVTKLK